MQPKFNRGNTGYVGPYYDAIMAALEGGNIREVWALMYALTKNSWETPFGETLQVRKTCCLLLAGYQQSTWLRNLRINNLLIEHLVPFRRSPTLT